MYTFRMLIPRFIEGRVQTLLQERAVVIIEGARAVGKTSLVAQLAGKGVIRHAVSLTDPTTLRAARETPTAWLKGLQQPFSVDEAQLAPELPLALKSLLDESGDRLSCVLTGSASIGRTGLGGADPLARRSAHLTLEPLSEAELSLGAPWSVIDSLFDKTPRTGASSGSSEWFDLARRGGMPPYRLNEARAGNLTRVVLDDISAILTDHVLPGERSDTRIARDVLMHVLRSPAGELKVDPIGNSLGLDRRTVNRYLDILERRFLITELPNYRRSTKQGTRASAKAYPVDTTLSAAALTSTSRSSLSSDAARGGLMEAHVVQQLRAHLGWTHLDTQAFHWRATHQGRTEEIDVILEDADGRIVAIEVKSGASTRRDDFRGIRSFRERFPDSFHRGFVIVGEGAVAPADETGELWRIPVSALADPDLWTSPIPPAAPFTVGPPPLLGGPASSSEGLLKRRNPMTVETRIFMSYAHGDQQAATGGDLLQFAADVEDEMVGVHERPVRIITDQRDVRWGDSLWGRLHEELDASIYLLPFITPRYLQSDACRSEFERFDTATASTITSRRILPLIWIEPRALKDPHTNDGIVRRVKELKYESVTGVRTSDTASAVYRKAVGAVAEQLEAVIVAHEQSLAVVSDDKENPEEDSAKATLDELFVNIEDGMPRLQADIESMLSAFDDFGQIFGKFTAPMNQSPRALRDSFRALANDLSAPSSELEKSASVAGDTWTSIVTSIADAARISERIGRPMPPEISEELQDLSREVQSIEGIADLRMIASSLPQMSSSLIPASRALTAALRTFDSLRDGVHNVPGVG